MFNINTFELQPFQKDFYATFQVAVNFDPENPEDCERWRKFLKETVQTDAVIEQLQEFFGYCLTRETRYEMCLVKIGDGADGKSTVQKLLRAMCGAENCTSVGFDALEDQFQRTMIYNKMVNMSSEVGGQVMESQYFKKIVSGDPITGSYKHKDGFEFVPFVKLVFAVNRMMKVKDNSDGWYRRLLPIWFKRQFLPGDPARDPHLETKLLAEINGIFAWALVGLERLRKRGGFNMDVPETQDILNEYKRMNSPVHAFVEDCCKVGGPDLFAPRTDLYKAYVQYCGRFGFGAMHSENFYNDIRGVVKGLRNHRPRLQDGARPRGFAGIGLLVDASS
jgi:putative DNA primase/helicase